MSERFRILRVVHKSPFGSFLDQNNEKDLLLPASEEMGSVLVGDEVIVATDIDREERPIASMRLEKYVNKESQKLKREQEVDLLIFAKTDLGYKAIINDEFMGLIYKNEVFRDLKYAEKLKGYVKEIRPDGKVDLILSAFGNKGADDLGLKIIETLEDHKGFLKITDKTSPEMIYDMFGVSKKKFKIALGGLYKKRLIEITDEGIRLL